MKVASQIVCRLFLRSSACLGFSVLSTQRKRTHIIACHIKLGGFVLTAGNSFIRSCNVPLSNCLSHAHAHASPINTQTNAHIKTDNHTDLGSLSKKNKLPHIPLSGRSYPMVPWPVPHSLFVIAEPWRGQMCRRTRGGLLGLQGLGMLIGKIVLISPHLCRCWERVCLRGHTGRGWRGDGSQ